ncbi:MAG: N-methylhydantoinase [Acidimicrobiaceae bacterium]
MTLAVDPTTLAVVRGYMDEVVDEMDLVQVKAAFSSIVAEGNDRANGLFRVESGDTVAQGREGSPIFVAAMQYAVKAVVDWLQKIDRPWEPGDAYLLNDPFLGGTHLNDAKLVAPFFWEGEPLLLLANTGHWTDVGAAQAGAFSPTCRAIFEEGIRLPVMRFARGGEIDPEVLELIRANNRLPDMQEGDLRSQLNALEVGRRRLERLFDRYGAELVMACVSELDLRSERLMEDRIAAIPDGTYTASDHLDDDGISERPIHLQVAITVEGRGMTIDFEGTDPLCEGPMNLALPTTVSACYTSLKHTFPDIPINAGCFRPVTLRVPSGSVLAAEPPHAVGGYSDVAGHVIALISLALVQAVPEVAGAAAFQTGGVSVTSGQVDGHPFVATFPYGGGYGATYGSDGLIGGTNIIGMARFPSIEMTEHEFPILWDRFGIRENSGGAGRWRGGCGTEYTFTVETDVMLSILGEQATSPPQGVLGGEPGALNDVSYTVDGVWQRPAHGAKVPAVALHAGDKVRRCSPGGGGFGPPEERDPALVERDLALGYVSPSGAD